MLYTKQHLEHNGDNAGFVALCTVAKRESQTFRLVQITLTKSYYCNNGSSVIKRYLIAVVVADGDYKAKPMFY